MFPALKSMIRAFGSKFLKGELLFFEICRILKSITKVPPRYSMPIFDLSYPAFIKKTDTPRAAIKEIMTVIRNAKALEKEVNNIFSKKVLRVA